MTNLLIFRWLLLNGLILSGCVAAWGQGYVQEIYFNDPTRITWAITALFAVSWLWTLKEIVGLSVDLNTNDRLGGVLPAWEFDRDKDIAKVQWLAFISGALVTLGLIGTFIGLKMAVAVDDVSSLSSAEGAKEWGGQIMAGFNVAINTTILGTALALWNDTQQRMLRTALSSYWADRLAARKGVNLRRPD